MIEAICKKCGFYSEDRTVISKSDDDGLGNYICPKCGTIMEVTEY